MLEEDEVVYLSIYLSEEGEEGRAGGGQGNLSIYQRKEKKGKKVVQEEDEVIYLSIFLSIYLSIYLSEEGEEGQEGFAGGEEGRGNLSIYLRKVNGEKTVQEEEEVLYISI